MPDSVPLAALAASSIVAFVIAMITMAAGRSGLYLILLFPIAIGFPTGYVLGRMVSNQSRFIRVYYWCLPILIGVAAFASTFYVDYELTMLDLQESGFENARELISFTTYIEILAQEPLEIRRNTQTFSNETGNPSDWYVLWTIEAGIVALSAWRGWKRGAGLISNDDPSPRVVVQ